MGFKTQISSVRWALLFHSMPELFHSCLNSPLQFTSAGSSRCQPCLTPRKGFTGHPPSWLESGLFSLVFQHHSYMNVHYSSGDLMGGEFTMLAITVSSWTKALEYHLMLFDMINNKLHFFFFSLSSESLTWKLNKTRHRKKLFPHLAHGYLVQV